MDYAHHIPGRLRIRSASIKHNAARAAALQQWLQSVPGVHSVQMNLLTGSALIYYNVATADGIGILKLLRDEGWFKPGVAPAPQPEYLQAQYFRKLLPPKSVQRALAKAILKAVAEAALERSVMAIAAAIL